MTCQGHTASKWQYQASNHVHMHIVQQLKKLYKTYEKQHFNFIEDIKIEMVGNFM